MQFSLTWNAFIFPNSALTTATFAVAKALDSRGIRVLGCIMTVALIVVWAFVCAMLVRAIVIKQVLWPEKQEDRDVDAWKGEIRAQQLRDARRISFFDGRPLEESVGRADAPTPTPHTPTPAE